MCVTSVVCNGKMMSFNTTTAVDFRSIAPRENQQNEDGVFVELTSHIDDDVIKRIPVLGPTRKQTELFFSAKHDKPCTADPIKRHHRNHLKNPLSNETSYNRPSSSYNAFHPQSTSNGLWLKQSARPSKINAQTQVLSRPTLQTPKPVSMVTNSATKSTLPSCDANSRHNNSLLTHWPNSNSGGYDTPPRYCVINSIGGNKNQNNVQSREHSSFSLKKSSSTVKDAVNTKSTQSYVITADTSSLLVQSRSPFRTGSTAAGSRARAKSAIQKVSEANYKNIVKSRSAQSRHLHNRSKQFPSDKSVTSDISYTSSHITKNSEKQDYSYSSNNLKENTNLDTTQENLYSIDNRSESTESSNYLKRYYSDSSLHPNNQRKYRGGTKQGRLSPRVVPVDDCDPTFLVVQKASTQQSLSKPHTPTKDIPPTSPMATRRKNDYSSSNRSSFTGNKISASNKKGRDKTLMPSKHGYHPRSNSPTFKRLVAAVERLSNTTIGVSPNSPVSKSTEDGCPDSASTDSHPGYRNFKDCYVLNDVTDSDLTESDGNSRITSDLRLNSKASHKSRSEVSGTSKNSKLTSRTRRYQSETRKSREEKPARTSRDAIRPVRNVSVARESDFTAEETVHPLPPTNLLPTEDTSDLLLTNGAYSSNITKEPETRVQEGQPTQLHFFLPQLADSMSEVSGATLTTRSHYQEQRIELLSRNDNVHQNATECDNGRGRTQNQNGGLGSDVTSKYSRYPPCDKSGVGVKSQTKQKHYPSQNCNGDKMANGDRCLPRDFRNQSSCNGHQSPNKEDASKHKRFISPARSKNSNIVDKTARRKQLTNNPNNNNTTTTPTKPVANYGHDYLDGQLPSEKLKKQIDNFPTLVSMEYSESPTPQQVR